MKARSALRYVLHIQLAFLDQSSYQFNRLRGRFLNHAIISIQGSACFVELHPQFQPLLLQKMIISPLYCYSFFLLFAWATNGDQAPGIPNFLSFSCSIDLFLQALQVFDMYGCNGAPSCDHQCCIILEGQGLESLNSAAMFWKQPIQVRNEVCFGRLCRAGSNLIMYLKTRLFSQ